MRIISRRPLREFWEGREGSGAEGPLRAWFRRVREAVWKDPADVKTAYPTASILKGGRAVFNIGGNKFRLVTAIRYDKGVVYIRFIGTHAQYDRIDVQEV